LSCRHLEVRRSFPQITQFPCAALKSRIKFLRSSSAI
jgi:hypothetical protein